MTQLDYGPVLIMSGECAGMFGLYDDDEGPAKAIVYLYKQEGYITVPRKHLKALDQWDTFFEDTMGYTLNAIVKPSKRRESIQKKVSG